MPGFITKSSLSVKRQNSTVAADAGIAAGADRSGGGQRSGWYKVAVMLRSVLSGFTDISLLELILIAGMALIASVVGGVAGYGTGALMPLVLVPIVGAEPVVPILSLSALFTNTSRVAAFWPSRAAAGADRAGRRGADLCARRLGLHHAHRQRRSAGHRWNADGERPVAPADAQARTVALK